MKWRYEIENDLGTFNITPKSGKDFGLTYTKADDRKFDYDVELKDLVLTGDDYKYFEAIETSNTRCELQTLRVYLQCGTDEVLKYEGIFAMSAGSWDRDKCMVSFKVKQNSPYTCLENEDIKNIYDFNLPMFATHSPIYFLNEIRCGNLGDCRDCSNFGDEIELVLEGWTLLEERNITFAGDSGDFMLYVREEFWVPCGSNVSSDWILYETCVEETFTVDNYTFYVDKYYRRYSSENESFEPITFSGNLTKEDECVNPQLKSNVPFGPRYLFINGFKLQDVFEAYITEYCNGITIVSDFFQWNPENQTSINYVTGETNLWTNLILHQKSDVKHMYPSFRNPSTKAEISFPELLSDILNIFNLGYRVENGVFRLEHISWFTNDLGTDLLNTNYNKYLQGTRKYNYNTALWYKQEKFQFMESDNVDFVGKNIVYNTACLENITRIKTFDVSNITTDIMHVVADQIKGEDKVSLDGFVLAACENTGRSSYININNPNVVTYNTIQVNPILDTGITINNALSWAYLHDKLWRHNRIFLEGNMNGYDTVFISKITDVNQEPFNVVLGCNALKTFDPLDKIRGALGWGVVQSAELKLHQCVVTFELALDSLQDTSGGGNTEYGDFDENFDENFD